MQVIRKILFWLHLTAGVVAGLVILTMSVTGVLLAFERQSVAFAERDLRAAASSPPLAPSALVAAAAREARGLTPSAVTVRSDARAPVAVAFGRERTLFVHRATGQVLGEGAASLRRFFRANQDVHRWLALRGEQRDRGRAMTGAANLAFLFIVLSGPLLWIPRRRNPAAWRIATWFRRGQRGKARDFNWHNVLGIWSCLPLIAIVASGVVMSYPWANALVYRAFGSQPPPPANAERPREEGRRADPGLERLDPIWTAASTHAARLTPRWRTMTIRLPIGRKGPIAVAVDEGSGARPDKRSQLMIDPASGRLVEHQTYASQEPGRQARAWLRWIHTGEAGGVAGQLVATIATAASVVLVWTGIALALRRLRSWLRRNSAGTSETEGVNA